MWAAISGAIQIIYLLLKNKFERDEAERKRKEALHAEANQAIKSGDVSRINDIVSRLRNK